MAVNLFTLDYYDKQVIKNLQVKAIQTVKKGSNSEKTNNKKKQKNKQLSENEQNEYGKELKMIFHELDLNFEYIIEKYKISVKVYDKDRKLILEDNIENLKSLLLSIKNEKGKIIDFKI
ncbi:MAG: hypothetical protein RR515_05600 [Clostridium sp.]